MLNFEIFHGVVRIGHMRHSMRTCIDNSLMFREDLIEVFVLFEHTIGYVNKKVLSKRAV